MKRKISCLAVLTLLLLAFSSNVSAQNAVLAENSAQQQRIDDVVKMVERALMLKDSETKKFASLYAKYVADIDEVTAKELKTNPTNDSERLARLKESFVVEEKSAEIKRKYVSKFAKILTPRQLEVFYMMENRINSEEGNNATGTCLYGAQRCGMCPIQKPMNNQRTLNYTIQQDTLVATDIIK